MKNNKIKKLECINPTRTLTGGKFYKVISYAKFKPGGWEGNFIYKDGSYSTTSKNRATCVRVLCDDNIERYISLERFI